jgi:inosose dehydratase
VSDATVVAQIAVANAPCSYGAFEETVGQDPAVPDAIQLLDDVAAAGYAGIDLGPVGYLGDAAQLPERLSQRGLSLAGGYLALSFGEPTRLRAEMGGLTALLDTFDLGSKSDPPPRPTLAAAGKPAGLLAPPASLEEAWSDRQWSTFADGLALVATACRERGYEPTFHHHIGSDIETPQQIDRMLELSDIDLCLDTGHLVVAGGDPVEAIQRWGERINHVHLKDGDTAAIRRLQDEHAPTDELWRARVFCRLGAGDLGCAEFVDALLAIGFAGWLVVEQDIFPEPASVAGRAASDQQASRAFLSQRGL